MVAENSRRFRRLQSPILATKTATRPIVVFGDCGRRSAAIIVAETVTLVASVDETRTYNFGRYDSRFDSNSNRNARFDSVFDSKANGRFAGP